MNRLGLVVVDADERDGNLCVISIEARCHVAQEHIV